MRWLFRHYRAWLRLKARKARGEALREQMRNEWRGAKRWECRHYRMDEDGQQIITGYTVIVGMTNALGDRRVRMIVQPEKYCGEPELTPAWLRSKRWESGADEGVEDLII